MSEASALQWLPALPPSTAPRIKAAIPWAEDTQATLQQLPVRAPDLAFAVSHLSVLECRVAVFFAQPDLQIVELAQRLLLNWLFSCLRTMGWGHLMLFRWLAPCNWGLMH